VSITTGLDKHRSIPAIALGRAVVEAGHSVLFVSATPSSRRWDAPKPDGQLADRLKFFSKPKLLIIDEFGYLPSSNAAPISSFSWSPAATP
jgi:DNA replication protein DnaC